LPNDFDTIFPIRPNTFVIPIEGDIDYDKIADGLECLEDVCGAIFHEDEDNNFVSVTFEDGTKLTIFINESELVLTKEGTYGILFLLRHSVKVLEQLGRKEAGILLADREHNGILLSPSRESGSVAKQDTGESEGRRESADDNRHRAENERV
jgi:hypothetical protein